MSKTHQEYRETGYIEDQRGFFDKLITQDWETYQSNLWDIQRKFEVSQILRFISKPKSVLDVGCGSGYHDVVFAQKSFINLVVGIDYSVKSISQAKKHYSHPKVKRFVANFLSSNSELKNIGQFDLVVSFQTIEHLTDPVKFINVCKQHVVLGGYIAIVTPNRRRLENRVRNFLGHNDRKIDPMHYSEYTKKELKDLGKSLGLRFVNSFAHTLSLKSKKFTIINPNSVFAVKMGALFPNWANVIGVIYQKTN